VTNVDSDVLNSRANIETAIEFLAAYNFYEKKVLWIETAVRDGVTALDLGTPLYGSLFVPELSPDQLVTAVERARAGGASGIALFNVGNMTDAHWTKVSGILSAWS
jgi:hypothetical protein